MQLSECILLDCYSKTKEVTINSFAEFARSAPLSLFHKSDFKSGTYASLLGVVKVLIVLRPTKRTYVDGMTNPIEGANCVYEGSEIAKNGTAVIYVNRKKGLTPDEVSLPLASSDDSMRENLRRLGKHCRSKQYHCLDVGSCSPITILVTMLSSPIVRWEGFDTFASNLGFVEEGSREEHVRDYYEKRVYTSVGFGKVVINYCSQEWKASSTVTGSPVGLNVHLDTVPRLCVANLKDRLKGGSSFVVEMGGQRYCHPLSSLKLPLTCNAEVLKGWSTRPL